MIEDNNAQAPGCFNRVKARLSGIKNSALKYADSLSKGLSYLKYQLHKGLHQLHTNPEFKDGAALLTGAAIVCFMFPQDLPYLSAQESLPFGDFIGGCLDATVMQLQNKSKIAALFLVHSLGASKKQLAAIVFGVPMTIKALFDGIPVGCSSVLQSIDAPIFLKEYCPIAKNNLWILTHKNISFWGNWLSQLSTNAIMLVGGSITMTSTAHAFFKPVVFKTPHGKIKATLVLNPEIAERFKQKYEASGFLAQELKEKEQEEQRKAALQQEKKEKEEKEKKAIEEFNSPQKKLSSLISECSICFTDFENDDVVVRAPCKHIWHKDCIAPWLENSTKCVSCNVPLPALSRLLTFKYAKKTN